VSTLLIIKGPQIGSRFALGERTSLGRGEECGVSLADNNVSRLHAEIERKRFSYTIRDLNSANGVIVNGERTAERLLRRNDLIVIGTTHLLFDAEPDLENALYGGKTVAMGVSHGETARVHQFAPNVEGSEGGDEAGRAGAELISQMAGLLDAAAESAETLPDLLQRAVARLVEMFHGERGAIFLWDALEERLKPAVAVCQGEMMNVDESLLMEAFREKRALLASDVAPDLSALESVDPSQGSGAPKLEAPRVGSVICAPLVSGQRCDGTLLVDHSQKDRFSLRDVRLLQAIGRLLAGPIETMRLRERLRAPGGGGARDRGDVEGAGGAQQGPAIIGQSRALADLLEQARRAAEHDVTVLIEGETGTGKELIASLIHRQSRRAKGPFVAVNCSAIPPELFESELFGHEKGAFTGAIKTTIGSVEAAHEGTLFLDEIGELSLAHQPKLLRFLQDHTLYRVGGRKPVRVNVRVIAATHADLQARAREERFRWDLFFRLNVVRLRVPPLRERREDIQRLAEHFVRLHSAQVGKPVLGITNDALMALERYDWPGNIRELENMVERAVILTRSNVLDREAFSMGFGAAGESGAAGGGLVGPVGPVGQVGLAGPEKEAAIRPLEEVEKEHIAAVLRRFNGNQVQAAQALGIHRNTLRKKLAEYAIR